MTIITVYPWTYFDEKNGIRREGKGMVTEDMVAGMGDKVRDPKIDSTAGVQIDDSELTQSGRYYRNQD